MIRIPAHNIWKGVKKQITKNNNIKREIGIQHGINKENIREIEQHQHQQYISKQLRRIKKNEIIRINTQTKRTYGGKNTKYYPEINLNEEIVGDKIKNITKTTTTTTTITNNNNNTNQISQQQYQQQLQQQQQYQIIQTFNSTNIIQRLQEEQQYQQLWDMTRKVMGKNNEKIPKTKGLPVKAVGPIFTVTEPLPNIGTMHDMANMCQRQGYKEAAIYYAAMNMMYQGGSIELFLVLLQQLKTPENAEHVNTLENAWMTVMTNNHLVHTMPYLMMARTQKDFASAQAMVTLLINVVPKSHDMYKKALLIKGDMCIHGQWRATTIEENEEQRLEEAIACFEETIGMDQQCARAYFCLGLCYSRRNDLKTAYNHYKQAASLGHAGAMNNLGYYYEHHQKDPKGAAYWYEASAAHESPIGMCNAGIFILQQVENYEGEEKKGMYQKALHYFETSAAAGHVFAMTMVAEMHRNGYGVPVSYKKAFAYYHQAANHGDRAAMTAIGFLYYTGSPPNLPLAFEYFSKASEAGDASAYYNLAIMYEQGIADFLQPDVDHAKHLFETSARMGYAPANAALGNVFWRRAMQNNDAELMLKARTAYLAAIKQGFKRATVHLTLLTETILKEQSSLGYL
mmetsp:Transcript_12911/g.19451  ORF Transcript_12911/g.19451 Transcript_12911/m.19451 type:complete len:627 (+) Transcript_12911:62-1942(+)